MIRAALVGAGGIARAHLAALRSLPGVELVGVCDRSPVMAESAAEEFGIPASYTDFEAMLRETHPDLVHITTSAPSHFALARTALRAGAHVFVEKPITSTTDELEQLLAIAQESQRLIVEDQNYVYNRNVRRLASMIESGRLGDVVHVDVVLDLAILAPGSRYVDPHVPHPSLQNRIGAISDFTTHLCSLACAFVGAHRRAQAHWLKRSDASPLPFDEMRAIVEAERGTAALQFSAHAQPDAFELRVRCTRARATAGLFEPLLVIERVHGGLRPLAPLRNGLSAARAHVVSALRGLGSKLAGRPVALEGLGELVGRTCDAIARKAPAPISPRDLLAVHRLEHALSSAEAQR